MKIPQQLFFYFQKAVAEKRRRGIPAAVIIVHVKHFSQRFQLQAPPEYVLL